MEERRGKEGVRVFFPLSRSFRSKTKPKKQREKNSPRAPGRPKLPPPDLVQPPVGRLPQRSPGPAVGHHLDDPALVARRDHAVGREEEVDACLAERVLQQANDLERQNVLAAVVADLEDAGRGGADGFFGFGQT